MPTKKEIEKTFFTPMVMACILLLLSIINLFFGKKCRIASNIYSGTILLTYTLIGVIVTFLMFFSEHPFTSANVNICLFNPLLIIPFVGLMIKEKKKYLRIINVVFILLAVFFILYSFTFWNCVNHAFIPLALVLIIELGVYLQ